MSLQLLGLGTAMPDRQIAQRDAAEMAATFLVESDRSRRSLAALYRTTRIQSRGSVLLEAPGEEAFQQTFFKPAATSGDLGPTTRARLARYETEAPRLAADAAAAALATSGVAAADVAHLVTCSCTGFSNPGVDLNLIERLGLSASVSRTHVGFMGCHAGFNALRVAAALAGTAPGTVVLTAAVELCSLHFQYSDRGDLVVANAIFADGAGAAVGISPGSSTPAEGWLLRHQASAVLPDSVDCMGWTIGDHGFEMRLSPQVPHVIGTHLPDFVDRALAACGLSRSTVGSWAVHPGGPRVLASVEETLELSPTSLDASRDVLAAHGNMSSATIFFILQRLRAQAAPLPCVAIAFGPGLTCELAVFTAADGRSP